MESHDSFFLYGDVCGFRLNAQFSGDGLDLATVLYRIALGGSLGELVPTLGKSGLSDSLDVSILWRTIPVQGRLRTGVGTGLRLWDAAEFSPGFSWVRGDVDWNLYTGDIWRVNVTGGVSYTDAWMCSKVRTPNSCGAASRKFAMSLRTSRHHVMQVSISIEWFELLLYGRGGYTCDLFIADIAFE